MTRTSGVKKGTLKVVLVLILALVFGNVSTKAATVTPRISQYYLAEGISHVDYYITDSVLNCTYADTLVSLINQAANNWVVTGYGYNPLYMYRTYDFNASNMDIYASINYAGGTTRGETEYWDVTKTGHKMVNPENSFWDYCNVYIYTNMHDWSDTNSVQGTIAHEMGHVFGLDHNNDNQYSVMCQWNYGRKVYKPGKSDHDGLNAMYGS